MSGHLFVRWQSSIARLADSTSPDLGLIATSTFPLGLGPLKLTIAFLRRPTQDYSHHGILRCPR